MTIPTSYKSRVEVLEMKDIKKEFQLVCSRLRLANRTHEITAPTMTPDETIALLVNANLFDDAIRFTESNYYVRPILEGLASRCVRLLRSRPAEQEAAWEWLSEYTKSGAKSQTGSEYRGCEGAAVDTAWNLLKSYVDKLEAKGHSSLHRAVVTRIMSLGAFLPAWLISSYQEANPAELLKLYLTNGYLQDASRLTCEYISAVLGQGKEYFGLQCSLHASNVPVWLPHNLIDQLLLELRDNIHDPSYAKLYIDVNRVLENYLVTVAQVSIDMVKFKQVEDYKS